MTEKASETTRKIFPLEIMLVTSNVNNNDESDKDEFDNEEDQQFLENRPTLTIQYNGQEYTIVLGEELIKNAFNRAFSLLGMDSVTVLKTNVSLQQVNTNSNSR